MQPDPTKAHLLIDNIIGLLAAWWRRQRSIHQNQDNLAAFSPDEMARIAQDVGLSPSELRSLAGHCSDAADLLDQRLGVVGLDPKALARTVPNELRDMERLCTLCQSKGRCARDLAAGPYDPVWRQYCPNEATITELAADARGSVP